MVEKTSARRRGSFSNPLDSAADYDYLREIVKLAKKNGWDMHALALVPKDLPPNPAVPVTKKEYQERNRLVKGILKRFDRVLTPPVPPDLEKSIRKTRKELWLPWQAEAIDKIDVWREQVTEIKPKLLKELSRLRMNGVLTDPADSPASH